MTKTHNNIEYRMLNVEPKHFTAEHAKIAKTHQLSTTGDPARRESASGGQRWAKMFRAAPRFVSGRSFEYGDFFRRPLRFKCSSGLNVERTAYPRPSFDIQDSTFDISPLRKNKDVPGFNGSGAGLFKCSRNHEMPNR